MPYIELKTNVEVTEESENALIRAFGKDITLLPGKSEAHLMIEISGGLVMSFAGKKIPCAIAEVKLFKSSTDKAYADLTAAMTRDISEELGIDPDCVYVKYDECYHWGMGGYNF